MIRGVSTCVMLALVLSGCSGKDEQSVPSPSPSTSSTGEPTTLIGAGAEVENQVEARGDLETVRCEKVAPRVWRVQARATNSTEEPVSYRLALRFADAEDGSVLARQALRTKQIEPGKSRKVTSRARLERKAAKVNCVFVAIERIG